MTLRCSRCQKTLPPEAFAPSQRIKSGKWCSACHSDYQRGVPAAPRIFPVRTCDRCGVEYKGRQYRPALYCSRDCAELARRESGRVRENYLRRKYGIGHADYDRMLKAQGGGCALCGKRPEEQARYSKYLHVDHNHDTGEVRGLLCDQHNLLLGRFNDDPVLLRRAVDYLEGVLV